MRNRAVAAISRAGEERAHVGRDHVFQAGQADVVAGQADPAGNLLRNGRHGDPLFAPCLRQHHGHVPLQPGQPRRRMQLLDRQRRQHREDLLAEMRLQELSAAWSVHCRGRHHR